MPIKRFNYTDRKKILRQDVSVQISDRGRVPIAMVDPQLGDYTDDVPPDASVFLEAYDGPRFMRWPLGSLGSLDVRDSYELTEFSHVEKVQFRLKVVGSDKRLLLVADGISGSGIDASPSDAESLLPLSREKLNGEIWRISFESDRPQLRIEETYWDKRNFTTSQWFVSLVFPAAVRQILTQLMIEDQQQGTDDPEDWRYSWMRMATTLCPADSPPPFVDNDSQYGSDALDWVSKIVEAIARKQNIRGRFDGWLNVTGSDQ